jgi:predicted Rossmann-fold nucleotide-binding protein
LTDSDLQVFVSGTWRDDKAVEYARAAAHVGELIAEAGCSLACGPGTGIARYAIDGFCSVPSRRGAVRYFLPAESYMTAVGEVIQPGYDEIVQTDLDYPMRNVYQISKSSGLIAITGGDGTLEEMLPALIDYNLPVSALKGAGQAAAALEALLDVFPLWRPNVLLGDDPEELARFILERLPNHQAVQHTPDAREE